MKQNDVIKINIPEEKKEKKSMHPTTEKDFHVKLQGFTQTVPQQLLQKKGSTIRYAIDTMDPSRTRILSSIYRMGGVLIFIDPSVRFMRLQNVHTRFAWSVQLQRRNPHERIRLWYMDPGTKDEIMIFRNLVSQIDSGEVQVVKKKYR